VDLNNFDAVSFGLSLNGSQFAFDNSKLTVMDPTDQALNGGIAEKTMNLDATFGFLVYGKQYYAGFSVPHLFESQLNLESEVKPTENFNRRHFQLMGSYKYYASDEWDLQPSAFIRFMGNVPVQMDLNVRAIYRQVAFGGLTYRHNDALAVMFGTNYREFVFGYSYDITTSRAVAMSPHTHELVLGYYLAKKTGKFRTNALGPRVLERSRVVN
jgi:type IX secretion system PorP/SprF family membrane protein